MVLNIYKLDDTEQQNIIACLPEGEHIIGRGELLNVSDKRVSRKHAIIKVSVDRVTLTSVHTNPCFFKASNGRSLTMISQNQESELNDGDHFALLPEEYWFRVKIKKEVENDSKAHGKRPCETNSEPGCSYQKRLKVAVDATEESSTSSNIHEISNNYNTSLDDSNHDNSTSLHNQDTGTILGNTETETNNSGIKEATTNVDVQEPRQEPSQEVNKELQDNGENDPMNTVNETNHSEIEEFTTNVDVQQPSQEVKNEPQDGDQNIHSVNREIKIEQPSQEVKEPKAEPQDGDESQDQSTGVGGLNGPQNSGPKTRRERCWYGVSCFRKNANHRELFSHPEDRDYDSDPEDDRPDCPYGVSCYRTNIQHRREYKHSAKPAAKPSNVRVNLNVGCQFCEHCRRKLGGGGGGKSNYESDVDDDYNF